MFEYIYIYKVIDITTIHIYIHTHNNAQYIYIPSEHLVNSVHERNVVKPFKDFILLFRILIICNFLQATVSDGSAIIYIYVMTYE